MTTYYIGWDVGGWNCDRNSKSRDALCIFTENGRIGNVWRGNLRDALVGNDCPLQKMWNKCTTEVFPSTENFIIAIDTPLGFPGAFTDLITDKKTNDISEKSRRNVYLFRHTERLLSEYRCACAVTNKHVRPLSPIKDMIGAQATKGIHFLRKCELTATSPGVFTKQKAPPNITAIETYPAVYNHWRNDRRQQLFDLLSNDSNKNRWTADHHDAVSCAVMAYWFDKHKDKCFQPSEGNNDIQREGWIWVPNDALIPSLGGDGHDLS